MENPYTSTRSCAPESCHARHELQNARSNISPTQTRRALAGKPSVSKQGFTLNAVVSVQRVWMPTIRTDSHARHMGKPRGTLCSFAKDLTKRRSADWAIEETDTEHCTEAVLVRAACHVPCPLWNRNLDIAPRALRHCLHSLTFARFTIAWCTPFVPTVIALVVRLLHIESPDRDISRSTTWTRFLRFKIRRSYL